MSAQNLGMKGANDNRVLMVVCGEDVRRISHFHIGNITYLPQPSNPAEHCCHIRVALVCDRGWVADTSVYPPFSECTLIVGEEEQ